MNFNHMNSFGGIENKFEVTMDSQFYSKTITKNKVMKQET